MAVHNDTGIVLLRTLGSSLLIWSVYIHIHSCLPMYTQALPLFLDAFLASCRICSDSEQWGTDVTARMYTYVLLHACIQSF